MKIDQNIRIHPEVNQKLRAIVAQRAAKTHSVVTSKGVIAELIEKTHKKECK